MLNSSRDQGFLILLAGNLILFKMSLGDQFADLNTSVSKEAEVFILVSKLFIHLQQSRLESIEQRVTAFRGIARISVK